MDVFLNPLSEDLRLIMESAPQYCSKLTIDGYDVPVDNNPKTLLTEKAPYYKGEDYYHVEYYLRKGTAIPEHSFRRKTFKSFVIPEGVKRIKNNAFVGCTFDCDLVLPNTLTFIDYDAFACNTVLKGTITIPKGITQLDCLPVMLSKVDEFILPEGLTSFIAHNYMNVGHLHIPASTTKCWIYRTVGITIDKITIDPANPVLLLVNGEVINTEEIKKKNEDIIEEESRKRIVEEAFSNTGMNYQVGWPGVSIILDNQRCLAIDIHWNNTKVDTERALNIAQSIIKLEESLPNLKGRILFKPGELVYQDHHRGITLHRSEGLIIVNFEDEESNQFLPLSLRYFEGLMEIENRIKEKYGKQYKCFFIPMEQ